MESISLEYLIGLAFTLLSGLCGAAWWMSSLYSKVNGCLVTLEDIAHRIREAMAKLEHVDERLNKHEVRIVRLEDRVAK